MALDETHRRDIDALRTAQTTDRDRLMALNTMAQSQAAALRDLQSYLTLSAKTELDEEERDEQAQIWEHVKSLRRRVG